MKGVVKKLKKKNKIVVFVLICLVGLFGILLIQSLTSSDGEDKTKVPTQEENQKTPLVTLQKIVKQDFTDVVDGITGKIDVPRAKLAFEIGGTVSDLPHDKGDKVQTGEILALLDPSELILKEKYKKNAVDGALIELEKAMRSLDESREKMGTGYLTQSKVLDFELEVSLRKNKLEAAHLELDSAVESSKKAKLHAPFDGVVLERKIEKGESISAGKEAFVLLNLNDFYADLEINERKLSKIKSGQSIELKTNVFSEIITGVIHSVVPAVQGKANVLAARAKLNKPGFDLLPGMFVIGKVIVQIQKNVVVIPLKALSKEGDKVFVFVFNESAKTVLKREIVPGYATRDEMVIQDKLSEGEKIVVDTNLPLKDGMAVRSEE